MNLYKKFGGDPGLEKEGVWMEVDEEVRFLVARAGGSNKKYRRTLERLSKPYMHQIRQKTVSASTLREISLKAFVTDCLLGWENVTDADGNALEFNEANALQLMRDLPDLYDLLNDQAQAVGAFQREELVDAGNV